MSQLFDYDYVELLETTEAAVLHNNRLTTDPLVKRVNVSGINTKNHKYVKKTKKKQNIQSVTAFSYYINITVINIIAD